MLKITSAKKSIFWKHGGGTRVPQVRILQGFVRSQGQTRLAAGFAWRGVSNAQAPYPPPCLLTGSPCRRGLAFPREQRFGFKIIAVPSRFCLPGAASFFWCLPVVEPCQKSKKQRFGSKNCGLGLIEAPLGGVWRQGCDFVRFRVVSGRKCNPF